MSNATQAAAIRARRQRAPASAPRLLPWSPGYRPRVIEAGGDVQACGRPGSDEDRQPPQAARRRCKAGAASPPRRCSPSGGEARVRCVAELLGVLGLDNDPPRCARRPLAPATQRCREIDALLLGAETAPVPPRAGWPRAPGGSGSSPRGVPPVPRIRSLHAARVVVARARHREAPYAGRVGSRADERPSDCGAPAAATPSHPSVA
jgi:hypothetical protein